MSKVKITCDSTADLSPELYEKYGIEVVPLHFTIGDTQYEDRKDITIDELFKLVKEKNILPKTSAASIAEYSELFKKWTDDGYEVVHVNISSGFSSCNQNANIAASELQGVYVVDSLNLSTGHGHLVLAGAELAQEGFSGAEIKDKLDEMAKRLDVSFVLDTLSYLHKGGRCSAVASLGANLLSLKPCIEVHDGKMGVGKKYRGKLENATLEYVKDKLSGRDDIQTNRIFVTHTNSDPALVEKVKEEIKKYQNFDEIIETTAGCTIACHCGPKTLGILFFTK